MEDRRPSRMLPYGGFSRAFGTDRLWKVTHTIIAARQMAKKVTFSEDGRQEKSTDALYSIFNFFETITPPPNFPTFKDGFVHVSKVVKMHPQFLSGVLLRNVEEYDRFPFLSYTVFHLHPSNTFIHDPSWVKVIREGHGENQVHHQGGFKELCTIWTDSDDAGLRDLSRAPLSDKAVYIIVCCKLLGNTTSMESNWREWSGAEFILNGLLPQQRGSLRRITFYKRAMPRGAFTHVLLAEFHQVSELYRLRDFIALMNSRHCGLAGLYTVELPFQADRGEAGQG